MLQPTLGTAILISCILYFSIPVSKATPAFEWQAIGSGCRARFDLKGDVIAEQLAPLAQYPDYQRVRFTFKKLLLDKKAQVKVGRDFARTCSVRLSAHPGSEYRLSDVIAITQVQLVKPKDSKLSLGHTLTVGAMHLDNQIIELSDAQAENHERIVQLQPLRLPYSNFPNLHCGEPKLLGVDFTWIASVNAPAPRELKVNLGNDASLSILYKTSPCPAQPKE